MADFGFIPELIAGGTINPFRFVVISAAFTGVQYGAASKLIVGATDGSVKSGIPGTTGNTVNAESGDQISLQPTNTIQIEAGAAYLAGAFLTSDANGRAVTAAATQTAFYVALEAAGGAGEINRAFRIGSVVV